MWHSVVFAWLNCRWAVNGQVLQCSYWYKSAGTSAGITLNIFVQQISKWSGKTGEQERNKSGGQAGRKRGSCAEFWKDLTRLEWPCHNVVVDGIQCRWIGNDARGRKSVLTLHVKFFNLNSQLPLTQAVPASNKRLGIHGKGTESKRDPIIMLPYKSIVCPNISVLSAGIALKEHRVVSEMVGTTSLLGLIKSWWYS